MQKGEAGERVFLNRITLCRGQDWERKRKDPAQVS